MNFLDSPVNKTRWAYMIQGCASFESQIFIKKTFLWFPVYNEAEGKWTESYIFTLRVTSKVRLKKKKGKK